MVYNVVLENPRFLEANLKRGGAVVATMLSGNVPSKHKASCSSAE